jgi:CBS domain-containing protein
MPGKADWLARGLPTEGEEADAPRVGSLVVDDVVTCALDERVGDVRERVAASRYGFALVVSDSRIVLGRLRRAALESDGDLIAEAVMEPGPSTIRPDTGLEPLSERMRKNDLRCMPVTTPGGELLGLVRRDDLEAALTSR